MVSGIISDLLLIAVGYSSTYETTHSLNSEPQNIEQEISNDEMWNRCAQSFFKNNNDRIPYFDIQYSLFDIRYSLFQSFFYDLTGRSSPLTPQTC